MATRQGLWVVGVVQDMQVLSNCKFIICVQLMCSKMINLRPCYLWIILVIILLDKQSYKFGWWITA